MKILIISSTPWDNANSFGNTFSNLFENMDDVEIYNIACRHGASNNQVVKNAVQLTDRSVLKSIYKFNFDPCWDVQSCATAGEINQELSENARKKRRTVSFILRDMIWKLGRWKRSKTLNGFLEKAKPDVIYLPIYASPYMCDIQQFIVNKLNIPTVGHISDDLYSYPPEISLLAKAYRANLRKKLRKLIDRCSYLEVFAENMKEEYSEIFNKPCYLIGKGVDADSIEKLQTQFPAEQSLHFVYTGNIGDDRYRSLADIGKAMSRTFKNKEAVLDIYSTTPLTNEMRDILNEHDCVKFHGGISKEQVLRVQQAADFLVHVEGFSDRAVFSAKMSFSTKIIDYMMTGKTMLAYGPQAVNSIQVLKKHNVCLTAVSQDELEAAFESIDTSCVDYEAFTSNAKIYLKDYRDIKNIQSGIYERMKILIEE